ncbi:predicted protein [Naegleria gruberi]|uniref:Predicted protein n=1 Tax=Naegleria gruberi TaxID=5762 RepID=D2VDY6_NAEGR|nr:uncharacterized protein NAEGRDRAFT_79585 [Naegleria gruberi]EFC44981.1 predicted protein [Naegleria gruberi]|eukprot:XP_002677725.1 predicted protein [Naegleria gruberi strain NEG-M]
MSNSESGSKIELEFEVVQNGIYGKKDFRDALILQSAKDCPSVAIKKEVETHTNFDTHVLVYVSSGNKPTGGYSVVVKKAQYDSEKKAIVVHAKDAEPKDSCATMALTVPFSVIRVKKLEHPFEKVKLRWMKKKSSSHESQHE